MVRLRPEVSMPVYIKVVPKRNKAIEFIGILRGVLLDSNNSGHYGS